MKKQGKTAAIWLTLLLMLTCCLPAITAGAAGVSDAVIDRSKTAALTIYKYDLTKARQEGLTASYVSTGEMNETVEDAYAPYAIEGVVFTYLKIADVELHTKTDQAGNSEVMDVYCLTEAAETLLAEWGLRPEQSIIPNRHAYLSDHLQGVLSDALTTDLIGTKSRLESFVAAEGGTAMPQTNAAGYTRAASLPLGLYLVVETAVPENVVSTVNPFLVSLPMTSLDGTQWLYDVTVYPKNETGNPDLVKEVAEITSAQTVVYDDTATASAGDIVAYRITSTLPHITSKATWLSCYRFDDTLAGGIRYIKNDVTMRWTDTGGSLVAEWSQTQRPELFRVTYEEGAGCEMMHIEMTAEGLKKINESFSDYTVAIDYRCRVEANDLLEYGENGNLNEVQLTWKRTNTSFYDTLKDDCLVYVYGLKVNKSFSDQNGDPQAVAIKLRNETDGYYLIAEASAPGQYRVTGLTENEANATTFSPDSHGELYVLGIEDDTYVLTEIWTDDGYILLAEPVVIAITAEREAGRSLPAASVHENHHTVKASAMVNALTANMENAGDSPNALVRLDIINERGFDLPKTGDSGSFLLPVIGLAIASGLSLCLLNKKRG